MREAWWGRESARRTRGCRNQCDFSSSWAGENGRPEGEAIAFDYAFRLNFICS